MSQQEQTAHAVEGKYGVSPQEQQERKQRVLTQGTPAIVRSIADAVVIKDENIFFLTEPDGRVPLGGDHGFGLYHHDCRFLNGYELQLAGTIPQALVSTAERGFMAVFQLTNPDIRMADGTLIRKEEIGVKWERVIDAHQLALHEVITFQNFSQQRIEFPVSLTFQSAFEDVYAVRELLPEQFGTLRSPSWSDGMLSFVYEGKDGLYRSLTVRFSPQVAETDGTTAHVHLTLDPRASRQIQLSLVIAVSTHEPEVQPSVQSQPDLKHVETFLQRSSEQWLGANTEVRTDSLLLNRILERSLRDLRVLQSTIEGQEFFAAGVPWFATLFGRDSVITALQTLAYNPDIAAQTLRLLASYQSQHLDEWRDAQPGKILHELRVGEMARLGEIPHTPYYGTIDATPLFLILIGRHAAWTGQLTLFEELRGHIDAALEWISKYGDLNGDGYVEYASTSGKGLINQGWKDSGDAIIDVDGNLATPPIALIEVQGYVYMAKLTLADLYERSGEPHRAGRLRREAEDLRGRFNHDFWLEEKGFYALALQADRQPVAVLSSNPGHALWAGIADPDKAQRTVERLMGDDMFNGWGVRTLSAQERGYNPLGYHLGTVWPHDNAIIAAGFRRYGFDAAASRVVTAITEAAMYFAHYQLPELFAGFGRQEYGVPVRYPVACHPQAWAAGSVPYLVEVLLGLTPEAYERRLRIIRPILPDFVDRLEVHRLQVGNGRANLSFERISDGVAVKVLKVEGPLEVIIEPEASRATASEAGRI
jgi:glycogen debranching enzyme